MPQRGLAKYSRRWLPLVVLIPLVYLLRTPVWGPIDNRFYNYFHSMRDVDAWRSVVVVGIDDDAVRTALDRPVYPLSRHTASHAALIRRLNSLGAKAVVLDMRLTADDFDAPPFELADAIRAAGNVYLAMSVVEEYDDEGLADVVLSGDMPDSLLVAAARGVLVVEVEVDPDGVLRRFVPDPRLAPIGLETLPEHLAGVHLSRGTPIVFPSLDEPLPYLGYADVLDTTRAGVDAFVSGRIAFVGSILDESTDYITVPRQQRVNGGRAVFRLPGVGALAAVTETLIQGRPLRDAGPWAVVLWNVLWSVLAVLLMPARRPVVAALVMLGVIAGGLLATGVIHVTAGLILPAGLLLGCVAVCGVYTLVSSYVETTRAYYIEEAENRRVHEEMRTARSMQEGFLPAVIPRIPPFDIHGVNISSLTVSGDYYDVIARDDRIVLAIGDVKGKGMPASLLMSNVQAGLHTQLFSGDFDVDECVSNLNKLVCENTTPEDFVTFALLELRTGPARVRSVRAGHELPFIVDAGGNVRKFEEGGPVLGLLPDIPFDGEESALSAGDVLCLYTDGVTEAADETGEEFGLERLIDTLKARRGRSARDIVDGIVEAVRDFSAVESLADDVTLVVVRVEGDAAA